MTEDGSQAPRVKFAPLTAGLLARKGEAHPAATAALPDDLGPQAYHLTRTPAPAAHRPVMRRMVQPPADRDPMPAAAGQGGPVKDQLAALGARLTDPVAPTGALAPGLAAPAAEAPVPPAAEPLPPALAPEARTGSPGAERCGTCPGEGADERRFHVSIRLKRSRYLRLKLAAATLHRPSQEIIGEALDAYFERLGPAVLGACPCIKPDS